MIGHIPSLKMALPQCRPISCLREDEKKMRSRMSSPVAKAAVVLILLMVAASAHSLTFTVMNVNDSGAGSLRQAITDSNNNGPGPNLINFNITPGVAPFIILPTTQLPTITVPVTINGLSQPGTSANTLTTADNAVQTIVVNGFFQPTGDGLTVGVDGCTIKSIVVNNFAGTNIVLNSNSNIVKGCYVGIDASGTIAGIGGGTDILINNVSNNQIGGTSLADRNIISADTIGLYINGTLATNNIVQGNFVGLASDGITPLPLFEGIFIFDALNNTVGGDVPGAGNVISGSTFANIDFFGAASGNVVAGNLIGTNASGTAAAGSATIDVMINGAPNNKIGKEAGAGNVISGATFGIQIVGATAAGNEVEFNKIGTDITGLNPIPNVLGVFVGSGANGNEIGESNIIAFNTGDGVNVDGAGTIHNTITQNSIFSNGGLGIDLTAGGNNMLPAPVLTIATNQFGQTAVAGTLTVVAEPSAQFTIEFFSDPVNEAGGKLFLGSKVVTTNGAGFASFSAVFAGAMPTGQFITATATDAAGNTSEFSNAVAVGPSPDLVVTKAPLSSPVAAGSNVTWLISVANRGNVGAANVVLTDTLPATLTFVSVSTSQGTIGAVLNVVTGNIGTLNPGQSATIAIVATVGAAVPNGTRIDNTATATTTTPEANTVNNTSTGSVFVSNNAAAALQIAVNLVSGNLLPPPGSTQTYVYRVTLTANKAVYGITATGNAPGLQGNPIASLGTVTVSGVPSNAQLTWRVVSMTAGQQATLLVTEKRTIPANATPGSLFQITGPWSASYYYAASKLTAGPTPPLNAIVTTP